MEQIDMDVTYNNRRYQIVSRLNPLGTEGFSSGGVGDISVHYLINGEELSEREWDLQLMQDKRAEAPQDEL